MKTSRPTNPPLEDEQLFIRTPRRHDRRIYIVRRLNRRQIEGTSVQRQRTSAEKTYSNEHIKISMRSVMGTARVPPVRAERSQRAGIYGLRGLTNCRGSATAALTLALSAKMPL